MGNSWRTVVGIPDVPGTTRDAFSEHGSDTDPFFPAQQPGRARTPAKNRNASVNRIIEFTPFQRPLGEVTIRSTSTPVF
jgi:hypothetical protein